MPSRRKAEPEGSPDPSPDSSNAAVAALVFEHSQDLILFYDWDAVVLEVNPAWTRALGWPREALVGQNIYDLIHPDDHERLRQTGAAVREVGDGRHMFRVRAQGGGWRWVDGVSRVVSPGRLIAILRDVTEVRESAAARVGALVAARDQARDAEAGARAVLENAPFASCILGPALEYISISAAWRSMFHADAAGPQIGSAFMSRMPQRFRRRFSRALKGALAGAVYTRTEEDVQTPDGRRIVRWQARPWRTPTGEIRGVIVYASDVTDLVTSSRTARTNAKRLELALEAADACVFEVDHAKRTFWAGAGFQKLVGRVSTYEEATRPWPNLHPRDHDAVMRQVAEIEAGLARSIEAQLHTAEGPRWTRGRMYVQRDAQGRPRRSVGLLQDIDEQKRQAIALAEAERRATVAAEAKSNFLANISHEIRTPMNGVLGVLQVIKREHLDPDELQLLDEALASGRMLSEMLDDLLDFSKIETGRFELHSEALDPAAVLVGVASLLQPAASAKGLKITAMAAPGLGMVRADPLRLRQALYNLMGNAVKFTPQGSIEARLTRSQAPDGSPRLRFEVQDTGIGVPEAFQATLFERFEQADGSSTRRHGGSGLGLAITRRLAEMMGGAVGFSSTPGQGSTFWIEIDGQGVDPVEAEAAGLPDIGDFRVLLVEDNPTNRLVISKILGALGVTVDTAEDGARGVELAAQGGYDLVLMDIQMPGMDGIEATRRIRAMDGPMAATPIVAVTANVLADQRSSYVDAGMNGVVAKPISAGALIAEIARVTERIAA